MISQLLNDYNDRSFNTIQKANPGTEFTFKTDSEGFFFFSYRTSYLILKCTLTKHFSIDFYHSNGPGFKGGIYAITTTDGNHTIIPFGISCQVGSENSEGYDILFQAIEKCPEMAAIINNSTSSSTVRHDRFAGLRVIAIKKMMVYAVFIFAKT